jgi:hypothetical protein
LEGKDKKEEHAVKLNDDECDPEYRAVYSLNRDSEQEDADAGFEENVRDNVNGFAAPPPLGLSH